MWHFVASVSLDFLDTISKFPWEWISDVASHTEHCLIPMPHKNYKTWQYFRNKPCRLWLCSLLRCLSDEWLREWDRLLCLVFVDFLLLSRSLDRSRELTFTECHKCCVLKTTSSETTMPLQTVTTAYSFYIRYRLCTYWRRGLKCEMRKCKTHNG